MNVGGIQNMNIIKKPRTTKIDTKSVIQSLFSEMLKNSNTHCFLKNYAKVFDSRVNLISLRPDIDFGNHPNRTHFTDLFKSEIKHFKKIFLKLQ